MDYRETPQGIWVQENPIAYHETMRFQEKLCEHGIAWHNPFADECTRDFGCCVSTGHYELRINNDCQHIRLTAAEQDSITKKDLRDGAYYVNSRGPVGKQVGMWSKEMDMFLCPDSEKGTLDYLPHKDDDSMCSSFDPIDIIWRGSWLAQDLYYETIRFQEKMRTYSIAWHNSVSNECTRDKGCCSSSGIYKVRINNRGQFTTLSFNCDGIIAKKDLIDGAYYVNRNKGRGMKVGEWSKNKNCFICIKPPKFGKHFVHEMPHTEDDAGMAIFEPIILLWKY